MAICWLASYPKSGNTWLRAMLTNYVRRADRPASINSLIGGSIANEREHFENYLCLDSTEMPASAVEWYGPTFQEVLADALPSPLFIKTHDAWRMVGQGAESRGLFSPEAAIGAVYLVRNPLDVAVSYAHHHRFGIDDAVRRLNDPTAAEADQRAGVNVLLPQRLSTWSRNVVSWMRQTELRVQVVRYEDMLADPATVLAAVVRFAGLPRNDALLERSVENSTFERLRAQEEHFGFREKHPPALSFFRAGRAGTWRDAMTATQVGALVAAHGATMRRFGYLDEAQAFLASVSKTTGTTSASSERPTTRQRARTT